MFHNNLEMYFAQPEPRSARLLHHRHQSSFVLSDRGPRVNSQLLRHLLEIVTLNNVADFVLGKIAELKTTFDAGAYLLNVILKSSERRDASVENRLAAPQNARAT